MDAHEIVMHEVDRDPIRSVVTHFEIEGPTLIEPSDNPLHWVVRDDLSYVTVARCIYVQQPVARSKDAESAFTPNET